MNTKGIQKHYDKLTARERFALTIQAAAREDEAERRALIDTAPKVTFEFPHTIGLHEGFRQLVKMHMIQQLGRAGTFFMLIGFNDDKHKFNLTEQGEAVTIGDAIELCARRFMEGLEAFAVICKEYDVDAEVLKTDYDYDYVLMFAEAVIRAWYGDDCSPTLLPDLESKITQFREIIETSRQDWAEARAK